MSRHDSLAEEPESMDAILASDRFIEQLRASATLESTSHTDAALATAMLAWRDEARSESLSEPPYLEDADVQPLKQPHRIVRRSVAVAGALLAMSTAAATAFDGDPLRPVRFLVDVGISVGEGIGNPDETSSSEPRPETITGDDAPGEASDIGATPPADFSGEVSEAQAPMGVDAPLDSSESSPADDPELEPEPTDRPTEEPDPSEDESGTDDDESGTDDESGPSDESPADDVDQPGTDEESPSDEETSPSDGPTPTDEPTPTDGTTNGTDGTDGESGEPGPDEQPIETEPTPDEGSPSEPSESPTDSPSESPSDSPSESPSPEQSGASGPWWST